MGSPGAHFGSKLNFLVTKPDLSGKNDVMELRPNICTFFYLFFYIFLMCTKTA